MVETRAGWNRIDLAQTRDALGGEPRSTVVVDRQRSEA
jgi:hypothetical protein